MKTIEIDCLVCGYLMDVPPNRLNESFLMCEECHDKHCWPSVGDDASFYVGAMAIPYRVCRVSASGHTVWMRDDRTTRQPSEEKRCFWDSNGVWRFSGDSGRPLAAGYLICGIRQERDSVGRYRAVRVNLEGA